MSDIRTAPAWDDWTLPVSEAVASEYGVEDGPWIFIDYSRVGHAKTYRQTVYHWERALLTVGQHVVVYGDTVDAVVAIIESIDNTNGHVAFRELTSRNG